jgi:glycosyltransferase involved in cell wall biosynthesis
VAAADCDIVGQVDNLEEYYRAAHAVVVPLRAGGGTRIKILEAFSQHRPVVSTGIGAEGLDVGHGRELLLADTPDDFAAQCLRLVNDTALTSRLTGRASRLLDERYTGVALEPVLARVLRIP